MLKVPYGLGGRGKIWTDTHRVQPIIISECRLFWKCFHNDSRQLSSLFSNAQPSLLNLVFWTIALTELKIGHSVQIIEKLACKIQDGCNSLMRLKQNFPISKIESNMEILNCAKSHAWMTKCRTNSLTLSHINLTNVKCYSSVIEPFMLIELDQCLQYHQLMNANVTDIDCMLQRGVNDRLTHGMCVILYYY